MRCAEPADALCSERSVFLVYVIGPDDELGTRGTGAGSESVDALHGVDCRQAERELTQAKLDGYEGTAPVGSFPPNGYGLFDMTGNTWEWTSDWFTAQHPGEVESPCCVPRNPRVSSSEESLVAGQPGSNIPRKVIKGGSHLCAPNYCLRYRPAARQGETIDTSTGHIGFRCIVRADGSSTMP